MAYLCHIFTEMTWLLHRGSQPVEHDPIEIVTVENDAHLKTHDKTKSARRQIASDRDCPVPNEHHQCSFSNSNHLSSVLRIRMRDREKP